jgi:hypothetical protein
MSSPEGDANDTKPVFFEANLQRTAVQNSILFTLLCKVAETRQVIATDLLDMLVETVEYMPERSNGLVAALAGKVTRCIQLLRQVHGTRNRLSA